ncbi:MAG: ABC transporter substrate-binding protein [Anaeromyxobacter sp. RBG_16_69_14]|nr:MAG: ABC transporter substrate-binding protein [Anaeromyxobacter sp. RBG_16_69_14]
MKTLSIAAALALAALAPAPADAALKVVTTVEGLASLAREVGGDRVQVTSLSRGIQDPHFMDANPTLAVKLRQADLLVDIGLDLEIGWLPPLVNQSRNPDIQPNGKRRLTAASAVAVMEVAQGPVDRSMGDLHPAGNPHFMSDPRRVARVAAAIAAKLGELDSGGAQAYQARLAGFRSRLEESSARWQAQLAPEKGRRIVAHHNSLTYFLDWAGLRAAGYLEPKPGIPPPPSHLAELVGVVKAEDVKGIFLENFYDRRSADIVAKYTGARVVAIPGDVGGFKDERGVLDPKDWFEYMGALVKLVTGALR